MRVLCFKKKKKKKERGHSSFWPIMVFSEIEKFMGVLKASPHTMQWSNGANYSLIKNLLT